MIIVSNNLQKYMALPNDSVIRINMAWVNTVEELEQILKTNEDKDVFLDYPQGRTKPPTPVIAMETAYDLCAKWKNVKYFAVSNIEKVSIVKEIQAKLPPTVQFVPKIETKMGIKRLGEIIYDCGIKMLMLDKEDLYLNVKKDNDEFFKCVQHVRDICEGLNVSVLELEGVVFSERKRGA